VRGSLRIIGSLAEFTVHAALLACTSLDAKAQGDGSAVDPADAAENVGSDAESASRSWQGGDSGPCRSAASPSFFPGPGACQLGRAYVACDYPVGASCDGGGTLAGQGGVHMGCISDDPTTCGCSSIAGSATCRSICADNEYAVRCGGLPRHLPDGGGWIAYQEAPDGCATVGVTPGGSNFSCCPCE
jgi:hypothetical protein